MKAEVALNLLKYFRWLVQSHKTTLASFYIAQKQRIKDSGWFLISGNGSSCKQTPDEERFVWFPGTDYIFFSLSFRNSPVGKASVKIMSEQFVFLCVLEYVVSKTASHSHTRVCHRVHHILLTQSHSQASLNDFCRCPLSLYLQCAVSE